MSNSTLTKRTLRSWDDGNGARVEVWAPGDEGVHRVEAIDKDFHWTVYKSWSRDRCEAFLDGIVHENQGYVNFVTSDSEEDIRINRHDAVGRILPARVETAAGIFEIRYFNFGDNAGYFEGGWWNVVDRTNTKSPTGTIVYQNTSLRCAEAFVKGLVWSIGLVWSTGHEAEGVEPYFEMTKGVSE